MDHSRQSIRAMFNVADFIVTVASQNNNAFVSEAALQAALIETLPTVNDGYQ